MIHPGSIAKLTPDEVEILERVNEKLAMHQQQQQQEQQQQQSVVERTPSIVHQSSLPHQTSLTQSMSSSTLHQTPLQPQPSLSFSQLEQLQQLILLQQQLQQMPSLVNIQNKLSSTSATNLEQLGDLPSTAKAPTSKSVSSDLGLNAGGGSANALNAGNLRNKMSTASLTGSLKDRKQQLITSLPRDKTQRTIRNTRKEEMQEFYQKCMRGISHSINIIKAVLMRVVFSLHSIMAIIYVYLIKYDEWYFINFFGVILLFIETFVTIIKRKGKEPRWFFPCFFIYICTMIPPIWFIELERIDRVNRARLTNSTVDNNINLQFDNETGLDIEKLVTPELKGKISMEHFAVGFEITLLLLVILGRWFLPKGNISRSTLSQLLLVYMSLASDIVDLLSLLNEEQVQKSSTMAYFTLAIFSWSLFQFTLNLVVTRGRGFQSAGPDTGSQEFDDYDEDDEENEVDVNKSLTEELNRIASHNIHLHSMDKKRPNELFSLSNAAS